MMRNITEIEWHNPRKKVWGFHVHQELPLKEFAKSLVIQKNIFEFLKIQNILIDSDDSVKPGYGPHLDYMWELRIESLTSDILEKMGLAISYMAINRFGLSAYIHPLMHDPTMPEEEMLVMEGLYNQTNALWFSYRVPQNQDFFYNPPKDHHNKIVDTRTPRLLSQEDKNNLYSLAINRLHLNDFQDPYQTIINGFHIHMDFAEDNETLALIIFDNFMSFLFDEKLRPTSTRIYGPCENGPHLLSGWEVKFETSNNKILEKIGIAIAWLMCNRQGMDVFFHPVTWEKGNHEEELRAHKEYSFFLGNMPELDLNFFMKRKENQ